MTMNERESPTTIRLYLFSIGGELYWSNQKSKIEENEAILLAGLIATINKFAREFLSEHLRVLKLNELRITMFNVLDQFLVALIMPDFVLLSDEKIEQLHSEIMKLSASSFADDAEEMLPSIIAVLSSLEEELQAWVQNQSSIAEQVTLAMTSILDEFEQKEIGIMIFSHDGTRLFKYFPGSSGIDELNYPLRQLSPSTARFLMSMTNSFLTSSNTLSYFQAKGALLVILSKVIVGQDPESALFLFEETWQLVSSKIEELITLSNSGSKMEGLK